MFGRLLTGNPRRRSTCWATISPTIDSSVVFLEPITMVGTARPQAMAKRVRYASTEQVTPRRVIRFQHSANVVRRAALLFSRRMLKKGTDYALLAAVPDSVPSRKSLISRASAGADRAVCPPFSTSREKTGYSRSHVV